MSLMIRNKPTLWYFADPMCSWCWGFSPVINALKENYGEKLHIALVMGGLRPGTTLAVTDKFRQEILHHWHAVEKMTQATFQYDNAMPDGFIYDTEPACRAIISAGMLAGKYSFPLFNRIQSSFYQQSLDVRREQELSILAESCGMDKQQFIETFTREDAIKATQQHFAQTKSFGVKGFPTLILQKDDQYHSLCTGYKNYKAISTELDKIIAHSA